MVVICVWIGGWPGFGLGWVVEGVLDEMDMRVSFLFSFSSFTYVLLCVLLFQL